MTEPLNPASLCGIVRKSLSEETGLKNEYDGIACLVHSCMLSTGFKFIGLGEEHRIDKSITAQDVSPLPADWNASSASMYAFRYTHSQSSMEFVVRISRIGKRTMIFGIAVGDDKTCSFDVTTQDYTSENFYPWKSEGNSEPLMNGFISMSRIKDFSSLFKINVLQKLIPGLNKEGYTEERAASSNQTNNGRTRPQNDDPSHDPLSDQPRAGYDPLRVLPRPNPRPSDWPPEFDDEYEMQGRRGGMRMPGGIGGIGADDLRPPGIDAMNPFGRAGGHRGMHPTPEDILFPDRGYGSPTYPSPGMPPAGARYDPVFPGDRNGLGGRGGRGLGRGGFNQFGSSDAPMDSDAHDSMFS